MAEYIEREAAIDAIMKVYVRTAGYKARERVFEAKEAVHRLPVADVAPVVHGRWIEENGFQICSECGEEHAWDEYRAAYCDVCGAKMDGDACNQVCKYNTPDRGCVAGELRARCDLANVAGERGNGETG